MDEDAAYAMPSTEDNVIADDDDCMEVNVMDEETEQIKGKRQKREKEYTSLIWKVFRNTPHL